MHLHECPRCSQLWKHGYEVGNVAAHLCPRCGFGPVWEKWGEVHRMETTGEVLRRLYRSGLLWFALALWLSACAPKWWVLSNHTAPGAPDQSTRRCVKREWSICNLSSDGTLRCPVWAGRITCSSGAATPEEQR